uniref:Interferon regulatory factor 10 n=1 Tax=Eptatretus burgeri TaxID=7764 RepID=A0A8C4R2A9_EPTBU
MEGSGTSPKRLKEWLIEQINSACYPGLCWEDNSRSMFRIPWKHAGKQDYSEEDDAAIFKAWALYKGKFHEGEPADPPTWKTRLRCALNKSPEFVEVNERSQLDISEPYKVYRILNNQHTGEKRKYVIEETVQKPNKSSCLKVEKAGQNQSVLCSTNGGIPYHGPNKSIMPGNINDCFAEIDFTFIYRGIVVKKTRVPRVDCLHLTPPGPPETLGHACILFPSAEVAPGDSARLYTAAVLRHARGGLELSARCDGLHARRLCRGRVYWSGPCAAHCEQPNKLERQRDLKLFDRCEFLQELKAYNEMRGPEPRFQVVLCFGEEFPNEQPQSRKLVTVLVESVFAKTCYEKAIHKNATLMHFGHQNRPLYPPLPLNSSLLSLHRHSGTENLCAENNGSAFSLYGNC